MSKTSVRVFTWEEMEKEKVTDAITRRIVTSDETMVSQIFLEKGSVVPTHHHANEQFSYLLSGSMMFSLGENGEEEILLRAGQIMHIPSNVPHAAEALEDTLSLDIFNPPRQDWLDGTDDYFRRG